MDQTSIDKLRDAPVPEFNHFIDGKEVPASDGGRLEITSPIDGKFLTTVAAGTAEDMQAAIAAAKASFEDGRWAKLVPQARKKIMLKWADLIEANALELAVLGVRDNGTEIAMAYKAEPMSAVATIRYYAESIDKSYGEIAPTADNILGLIHREPIGVVGAIIPWNFPLMIGAWKIAPALACGNSVVVKPSETASLTLLKICQLGHEAGVPDGVLNIVSGQGAVVGEVMGLSMDVDVLAFTGSGGTGRRLLQYSAQSNLKRVYLELGGKSPHIIFDDAKDLDKAAAFVANGIFRNAGEVCVAGSRLLVAENIHDEFVEKVAKYTATMKLGDPLDITTQIGAVNSEIQLAHDLKCVEVAISEGGHLVTGGERVMNQTGGTYMAPTIITNVKRDDSLAQKEVFGPVLAVTPFKDEAEAIELTNSTDFGLASGLWTSDLSRAHRMVRSIRAGVVHVNTYGGPDVTVPLGGVKQSGNGHDKSLHALDKYSDLKTAWIAL